MNAARALPAPYERSRVTTPQARRGFRVQAGATGLAQQVGRAVGGGEEVQPFLRLGQAAPDMQRRDSPGHSVDICSERQDPTSVEYRRSLHNLSPAHRRHLQRLTQ